MSVNRPVTKPPKPTQLLAQNVCCFLEANKYAVITPPICVFYLCTLLAAYLMVRGNPGQLLYLLDDLPGKAHDMLSTGEKLAKSLICDNFNFTLSDMTSMVPLLEETYTLNSLV
ncbi:hypothetical protein DSO57_1015591 [Entomophthora muscae]|uniref:Uncharacterized protein n=1 Tax=Entomophthora muscae TaxID=34485 RepID=A0ACC2TSQ7_9FUNG|nr:hypothetical protein DSO57_1015591 [Entomophthora muscae]